MDICALTDGLSVAPQIGLDEVARVAECGFAGLLCNRPDGEEAGQPGAAEMAAAAARAGLQFAHQPVISGAVTAADVAEFARLLGVLPGPVLAYCRSGTRCSTMWALMEAPRRSVDEILAICARAGYDYSGLRASLEGLGRGEAGVAG
ncbi:MAG: TIGR01244 family phosphatase [Cellvibrionales bacterium]|nr:TIGR01244 family phosphatase [Cellvibrionales bacterium]